MLYTDHQCTMHNYTVLIEEHPLVRKEYHLAFSIPVTNISKSFKSAATIPQRNKYLYLKPKSSIMPKYILCVKDLQLHLVRVKPVSVTY